MVNFPLQASHIYLYIYTYIFNYLHLIPSYTLQLAVLAMMDLRPHPDLELLPLEVHASGDISVLQAPAPVGKGRRKPGKTTW